MGYDEALLAICSEVIGPRLPDGFGMFEINDSDYQLRIAEWYFIKNDCYDIYKAVNLAIDSNKQYSKQLPSQHVSDMWQRELRQKTMRSAGYQNIKMQFKKITEIQNSASLDEVFSDENPTTKVMNFSKIEGGQTKKELKNKNDSKPIEKDKKK